MDPEQIRSMRRMIRELKGAHTVILSTHILAEAAQVADRIVILSEGDLISSGRPSELESAYLAGENIYRVGFRGRLHEIEEKIARIPEVVSWELIGSSPEHHRGEVRINREIAEGGLPPFFAERGLLVFEYAKKEMHLEDIFLKAVTEERAR
jgi:ABC-2 type transport system ATP-binding protein